MIWTQVNLELQTWWLQTRPNNTDKSMTDLKNTGDLNVCNLKSVLF